MVFWWDNYFDVVEYVVIWIVSCEVGIVGDFIIGMFIIKLVVIYNYWNSKGDYFIFIFYINLVVVESCYLCFIIFIGLGFVYIVVDIVYEFFYILVVV